MARRFSSIIIYLLALTLLNGCVATRGLSLPRYGIEDIGRSEPHRYTYEAHVTGPVREGYPHAGPERGLQLNALTGEIDSISKEIGVEMVQSSSASPDIRLALFLLPDPPPGILGQYYGYLVGITLLLLPAHDKANYLLVADVLDNNGNWKRYRYEQAVHTWIHLFLLPFAFSSHIENEEKKAIRDLALNFFHDLQNERAVQAEK